MLLAKKHDRYEWYLRIQIEDKHEYKKALEYMATLDFEEVRWYMHLDVYPDSIYLINFGQSFRQNPT